MAELTGPDLTQGVAASQIVEGGALLGHAGGEAVLVTRHRGEILAVGATCSHYGGPLAEGLLVDGTVRCPWHHACFDLASGEVVHAPALNPLPCYNVEQRSGIVHVLGKRERGPARPPAPPHRPSAIVILGGGAAGQAALETLRQEGYDGPLTMVSADAAGPVDRPNLSKDYLAGSAQEDWIPLRGPEFYQQHEVHLERSTRIVTLDAKARVAIAADGRVFPYGALLLCTGAEPIRLPLPGAELPHVHTLRSLADSTAIIAAAGTAKRVVVMGASFIGLEVAAALRTRGLEVHVVAPDAVPLERVLGPAVGAAVRRRHEARGVVFHLGDQATAIATDSVTLKSGGTLAAELVVLGVGVRPSTALAEQAGCRLDRGVVVDAHLETTVPGIFAAGDIARWPDPHSGENIRVEHWVVAQRQGQAAARSMLGRGAPFSAVPFFWSQHHDVSISYVGHAEAFDRVTVSGDLDAWDATVAYRRKDRILAVATLGRDRVSLEAEAAMERGDLATLEHLVSR